MNDLHSDTQNWRNLKSVNKNANFAFGRTYQSLISVTVFVLLVLLATSAHVNTDMASKDFIYCLVILFQIYVLRRRQRMQLFL